MADDNILGNIIQFWPIILIIIVLAVIVIIIAKRRKPDDLDYKPQQLKKTLKDSLNEKLKFMGRNVHGNAYIGMQRVAIIRRLARVCGQYAITEFDPKTREVRVVKDEPIKYDIFIIESLSNNFIVRMFTLGMLGRFKMIIRNDGTITIDGEDLKLPEGCDMVHYGKVWANSLMSIQYLNDISVARLLEQQQMSIENVPLKFNAIEMHQVKTERTVKEKVKEKKNLYKEREDAGDSDIEA